MRPFSLRAAAAGLLLLWGASIVHAAEQIIWAKSYAAAMAQAKQTRKLIMADFYTDWCGWCKKLDAETYKDKKVIQLTGQFVPVKINAEKEGKEVARQFGVRGFPTILFISIEGSAAQKGEVVGQVVGYRPPDSFIEETKGVLQAHREFPRLLKRYQQNPDDVETIGKLVVIYHKRQNDKKAAELLAAGEKKDPENSRGYLTKAYNAVADSYQEKEQFDKAIPLFRRAAQTAKDTADIVYARMSIATCYLMQRKMEEALPEIKAVLEMSDAPKEDKEQAQRMFDWIERQKSNK